VIAPQRIEKRDDEILRGGGGGGGGIQNQPMAAGIKWGTRLCILTSGIV